MAEGAQESPAGRRPQASSSGPERYGPLLSSYARKADGRALIVYRWAPQADPEIDSDETLRAADDGTPRAAGNDYG